MEQKVRHKGNTTISPRGVILPPPLSQQKKQHLLPSPFVVCSHDPRGWRYMVWRGLETYNVVVRLTRGRIRVEQGRWAGLAQQPQQQQQRGCSSLPMERSPKPQHSPSFRPPPRARCSGGFPAGITLATPREHGGHRASRGTADKAVQRQRTPEQQQYPTTATSAACSSAVAAAASAALLLSPRVALLLRRPEATMPRQQGRLRFLPRPLARLPRQRWSRTPRSVRKGLRFRK